MNPIVILLGEQARQQLAAREEKERHKEIMRRMREGYDGRRGGIASGAGARGMHRFDQLVAADNREDAKRLGLLNEDEMDSDEENETGVTKAKIDSAEDEDEAALLDKMLKERFLNRDEEDLFEDENFSDDEEDDNDEQGERNLNNRSACGCVVWYSLALCVFNLISQWRHSRR